MGPLPRTHGMLGAMLDSAEPHRTEDITADPRFRGWWPRAHPMMRSFLGVPIVARGEVHRRALPDREGGRVDVLARRPEGDRAAGGARRDRDRERAAARAQPRAEHRRGAQPARARAARLRHAAAVRRRAGRGVGLDAARARPRRRGERAQAGLRARARRDGGAARGGLRAAARRRWRPRGWRPSLRKHVEVLRRVAGQRDRALRLRRARARRQPGDPGAADRPGGARQRRPPRRRRAHRGAAARARRARWSCRSPTTAAASIPRARRCAASGSG